MPLKIPVSSNFEEYYPTITKTNQLMLELINHPLPLPWNLSDPFQRTNTAIRELFERIDTSDQYYSHTNSPNKKELLETHSFISVLFFYLDGHRELSDKDRHFSIKPYSKMYLIPDNVINAVVENIKTIILPAQGLILISKNDVVTRLMNEKSPGFNRVHMTLSAQKNDTLTPLISQNTISVFNRHPSEVSTIIHHLMSNEPKEINMLAAYAPAISDELTDSVLAIASDVKNSLRQSTTDLTEVYVSLLLVYYVRIEVASNSYHIKKVAQ